VDLSHRPPPYQSSTIRFYNNLQYRGGGLPNYAEIEQDIVGCGLDCGLEKVHEDCGNPTFSFSVIPWVPVKDRGRLKVGRLGLGAFDLGRRLSS
jgi:hypothetical protein